MNRIYPVFLSCLFICLLVPDQATGQIKKPWKVKTPQLMTYADSQLDSALVDLWSMRRKTANVFIGINTAYSILLAPFIGPNITFYSEQNGNTLTEVSFNPLSAGLATTWIVLYSRFSRKKLYYYLTEDTYLNPNIIEKVQGEIE